MVERWYHLTPSLRTNSESATLALISSFPFHLLKAPLLSQHFPVQLVIMLAPSRLNSPVLCFMTKHAESMVYLREGLRTRPSSYATKELHRLVEALTQATNPRTIPSESDSDAPTSPPTSRLGDSPEPETSPTFESEMALALELLQALKAGAGERWSTQEVWALWRDLQTALEHSFPSAPQAVVPPVEALQLGLTFSEGPEPDAVEGDHDFARSVLGLSPDAPLPWGLNLNVEPEVVGDAASWALEDAVGWEV